MDDQTFDVGLGWGFTTGRIQIVGKRVAQRSTASRRGTSTRIAQMLASNLPLLRGVQAKDLVERFGVSRNTADRAILLARAMAGAKGSFLTMGEQDEQ